MSITSILVPLTGDGLDRRRLDAALAVAPPEGGHMTALYADLEQGAMPGSYVGDGVGFYQTEEFIHAMTERDAARRKDARDTFESWAAALGGKATAIFDTVGADATDALRAHGVVNDLAVAILPGESGVAQNDLLEAVLFGSGKPVLAVPREGALALPGTPAVIAWDGHAEAGRAVAMALPLLRRASSVTVLHLGEKDAPPLLPLTEFLGRHGVTAQASIFTSESGSAGAALLEEAERLKAGLFILGAYSHSRAREFLFGGVTRHVLRHANLPLFLAH